MEYEPTIGLEIHVELKTKTKMFCDNLNDPDEKHPNLNICPICLAHPGILPVINEEAVNKLIGVGLALNCEIAEFSKFDRKNYFYPDLPKGYQISQYDLPICKGGWLDLPSGKIRIERIHLEEDAGKLIHPEGADYSLVDYNRAGVPLMELVTKPDLKKNKEIEEFGKELRLILRYLDASEANMEKGQMRIEVNISGKRSDSKELGTKIEIKNINSFKNASLAAGYVWEQKILPALEKGGKIKQETYGWDDVSQKAVVQRTKEGSADYRYFPEPDLPPLRFSGEQIEKLRVSLPELPAQRRIRFKNQYRLNDSQIEIFTLAKNLGDYFEKTASELDSWDRYEHLKRPEPEHQTKLYTLAANYLITEIPPLANMAGMEINELEGLKITPAALGELVIRIFHQEISSAGAKIVLKEMAETGLMPGEIIEQKNLGQISDIESLHLVVESVIMENRQAAEDYKKGKEAAAKFLIGRVMAATKGRANPQVAAKLLEDKLK